ncbi:MAG: amino acid ABC transporter permease [Frankiaceae bacterium]|nr:amino acid ABC transporter permease [Frankiaceae bacterium]
MEAVVDNLDLLLEGFLRTLTLTALAATGALCLGTLVAAMRVSPLLPLRWAGTCYVESVRNTPLTVVFALAVFGLPKAGLGLTFFQFALLALTLYTGTFVAEAVRSGVNSVAPGQSEAARTLGMSFPQTLGLVILPQAFRNVIPPLASVFIALLKNSSIASAFGVAEATSRMGSLIEDNPSAVLWLLAAVALGYVVLALAASLLFSRLERSLAVAR